MSEEKIIEENNLWTVEDVAKYLGVSVVTARNYMYHREMPFIKFGGRVRYRQSDIDEWLLSNKRVYKKKNKDIVDKLMLLED